MTSGCQAGQRRGTRRAGAGARVATAAQRGRVNWADGAGTTAALTRFTGRDLPVAASSSRAKPSGAAGKGMSACPHLAQEGNRRSRSRSPQKLRGKGQLRSDRCHGFSGSRFCSGGGGGAGSGAERPGLTRVGFAPPGRAVAPEVAPRCAGRMVCWCRQREGLLRGGKRERRRGGRRKTRKLLCDPVPHLFKFFFILLRVGHLGGLQPVCVVQVSLVFNNGKCNYLFIM